MSEKLTEFIDSYDEKTIDQLIQTRNTGDIKKDIDTLFDNNEEVIYIPAGHRYDDVV